MRSLALRALILVSFVSLSLALSGCTLIDRTFFSSSVVSASNAWMRAVPADAVGAVYFEIHNPGRKTVHVVEARFEDAEATEIHETVQDGDIMRMVPLEDGFSIAGRGTTVFEPGGKHIMLIGLQRDMEIGDTESVTLIFKDGASLEFQVEVRDPLDLGG